MVAVENQAYHVGHRFRTLSMPIILMMTRAIVIASEFENHPNFIH